MTTIPRSHGRAYAIAHPGSKPPAPVKQPPTWRTAYALAALTSSYAVALCLLLA